MSKVLIRTFSVEKDGYARNLPFLQIFGLWELHGNPAPGPSAGI